MSLVLNADQTLTVNTLGLEMCSSDLPTTTQDLTAESVMYSVPTISLNSAQTKSQTDLEPNPIIKEPIREAGQVTYWAFQSPRAKKRLD